MPALIGLTVDGHGDDAVAVLDLALFEVEHLRGILLAVRPRG
jgi:hypothetical protein